MKKFLSLVLALVMTMSLVTISAGATDFTDDSSIKYEEAVKVMDMLGVVGGYSDGTFRPTANLTRGAAAKIITNIKLTPAGAEVLKGSETPFKDVPATNVFSGAIAYCASEGIISGYADGTFRPAGTLTGNAFMKMLIGALGYDTTTYTGKNFATKVALTVKDLGLAEGTTFVGAKAATREEACLYAFNALQKETVTYVGGTSVTINGAVIAVGAEIKYGDPLANALKLNKQVTTDKLGRPATEWYIQGTNKSVVIAETPVLTMKGEVTVKGAAVALGLGKNETAVLQRPGREPMTVSITGDNTKAEFGSSYNSVTYFYANTDKDSKTDYDLYTVAYTLTTVEKVNAANAKKETARNIKLTGVTSTYETESFAAGDYVFYATEGNKVIDVIAAETVEGKITGKLGDNFTLNGKSYAYDKTAASLAKLGVKSEGTFVLSVDGSTIVAMKATEGVNSELYAYVYGAETKTSGGAYVDGVWVPSTSATTVYFVKDDGTLGSAVVASTSIAVAEGKVYNYALNSKGEFEALTEVNATATNLTLNGKLNAYGNKLYPSDATEYVFMNPTMTQVDKTQKVTKMSISKVTGYKNANADADKVNATFVVVGSNNSVETVFVVGEAKGAEVEGLTAIVTDARISQTLEGDEIVFTFKAFNGEDITLQVAAANTEVPANGTRFEYKLVDGKVVFVNNNMAPTYTADVELTRGDDVVLVGGQIVTMNANTVVYVKDGAAYSVGAKSDVTSEMNAKVWVNNGVATLIVLEAISE